MDDIQGKKNALLDQITTHQNALREALFILSEYEYSEKTRRCFEEALQHEERLTNELAFVKSFVAQGI